MTTLSISVSDFIEVKDIVLKIKELFDRILDFFLDKKIEVVVQEVDNNLESRGPPTLGISVNENVLSRDRFGQR